MIKINLAPVRARRRRAVPAFELPSFNFRLVFGVLYAIAFLGSLGWGWKLYREGLTLAEQIERDRAELTTIKTKIGQAGNAKELYAELQKRVQTVQEITKNQSMPIHLVDAFADVIPRDLWITALEEKPDHTLKITGSAFSTTAVADFMSNLRSSGKFKDVDILVSRQDLAKTPRLVTFEVTCRFEA